MSFKHISQPYGHSGSWVPNLIQRLAASVQDDAFWSERIADCVRFGPAKASLHLAVFVEPFLSLLMAGTKMIESRFSQAPVPPFNLISPGDLVLLKRSGGEIVGVGHVGNVRYLRRSDSSWQDLRHTYERQLCATDDDFWVRVSDSWFASFIWFDQLKQLPAIDCSKQDRRGWVVIKHATDQLPLEFK